jgi:hypothetical protein
VKAGDLVKIDKPEFTSVAYGILVQYYENGWWQLYQRWDGDAWYMSTAKDSWMEVISDGST